MSAPVERLSSFVTYLDQVAQLVERPLWMREVAGASPVRVTRDARPLSGDRKESSNGKTPGY